MAQQETHLRDWLFLGLMVLNQEQSFPCIVFMIGHVDCLPEWLVNLSILFPNITISICATIVRTIEPQCLGSKGSPLHVQIYFYPSMALGPMLMDMDTKY